MDLGREAMGRAPGVMAIISGLVVVDWIFSAMTLWFCFRAFGITLSVGQLISGFVIGTVAGVASLFPGGFGMQEVSITGVLNLFGVSVEQAALAAILYRGIYSIVPYLVSLAFYRLVLRPDVDGRDHLPVSS
jgi:uncharacterized protein (TIRG00374 family)